MTTNSVRSQENRQNTQLHPGQDPDIDFHYTFEIFLPKGQSTVYIMKDHEAVGRVPNMAFWNSAKCSDSYYKTQALDIEDPSDTERDEPEILPKQYHQIHVLDMNKPYRPTKTEISAQEKLSLNSKATKYRNGIDEHNIINKDGKSVFEIKEGEAIPGLARDHKVQITKNTEFDFVDLNFGVIDNCKNPGKDKVLTVQAKDCPSCPKIDLPSKACAYDKNDGKIKCSDFGDIRTIERSADSVYYMTITRDTDKNYKFYFSDKDGNKTNDLELRLNDVKIKDPYLLRALESDYNIQKLSEKFEEFQKIGGVSPDITKVAEELTGEKKQELGGAILHAIANRNESGSTEFLLHLANDQTLQTEVATKLVTNHLFSLSEAVANKPEFPKGVAYALLSPNKAALTEKFLENAGLNPNIDLNDAPKTLIEVVKEKLAGDSGRDVNLSEIAAQLVTGTNLSELSTAVAEKSELQTGVAGNLIGNSSFFDRVFKHEIEEDIGTLKPRTLKDVTAETLADDEEFQEDVASEVIHRKTLIDKVKEKLIADEAFKNSVKGEKGDTGPQGPAGVQAASRQGVDSNLVATELERSTNFQTEVANKLITTKASDLGRAVLDAEKSDTNRPISATVTRWAVDVLKGNADFQTDVANNPRLKRSVIDSLKADQAFQDSVKGETGPVGPKGFPGQDGISPTADEVARQSVLQAAVANNSNFRTNVKDLLKADQVFRNSVKGKKGDSANADEVARQPALQTAVANKLITTKAHELGRAVVNAEQSDPNHPIATTVTRWAVGELKGSADFQTGVATELLTGRNNITQLGQAVLDVEKSDASGHPISTIVTPWIVDSLERSTDSIQKYEEQVKKIEARIEDEEREIFRVREIATKKAEESAKYAQDSHDAAIKSEGHEERAKIAADLSERHAKRSETAAGESGKHAKYSKDEAELSKNHANESKSHAGRSGEAATTSAEHVHNSKIAACKAEGHATTASSSSRSAASYASNAKEIACTMDPAKCASHPEIDILKELDDLVSECEIPFIPPSTDSVSVL